MPMCAVIGCNRIVGRNVLEDDGLTPLNFFGFPNKTKEPTRFKAWVHFCGRKDLFPSEYKQKLICSRHFIPSFITGNRLTRPRLKPLAYPSQNLPSNVSASDLNYGTTSENTLQGSSTFGHMNESVAQVISEDPIETQVISENHTETQVISEDAIQEIHVVALHPIKDIVRHKPEWVFYNNDKIVWYLKLSVVGDLEPEIVQSVKVNTDIMDIKFFHHNILLQPKESSCIVMNLRISILEDFIQVLNNFENFNAKKNVILSLASKVRHVHHIYHEKLDTGSSSETDDDYEDRNLLFIHEQLKMLAENPNARRWNPSMIRLAMLIHDNSPAAYRAMIQSGYVLLPTERTLSRYRYPVAQIIVEPDLPDAISSLTEEDGHFQLIKEEMQICSEASNDEQ